MSSFDIVAAIDMMNVVINLICIGACLNTLSIRIVTRVTSF